MRRAFGILNSFPWQRPDTAALAKAFSPIVTTKFRQDRHGKAMAKIGQRDSGQGQGNRYGCLCAIMRQAGQKLRKGLQRLSKKVNRLQCLTVGKLDIRFVGWKHRRLELAQQTVEIVQFGCDTPKKSTDRHAVGERCGDRRTVLFRADEDHSLPTTASMACFIWGVLKGFRIMLFIP